MNKFFEGWKELFKGFASIILIIIIFAVAGFIGNFLFNIANQVNHILDGSIP